MKIYLSFLWITIVIIAFNVDAKGPSDKYRYCHKADIISNELPTNNQASPLEICFLKGGKKRRLRLYDGERVKIEIIEDAPIHVRERVFICPKYFLLSDGSLEENLLGHVYDNMVYRISDGQKMTSFSSHDLPKNDCSIFIN